MLKSILSTILVIAAIAIIMKLRYFLLGLAILTLAGSAVAKYIKTPQNTENSEKTEMRKNLIELFLCLFLGWAGAHKFYRGNKKTGLIYLFTLGILCVGWWGDLIQICKLYFGKEEATAANTKSKLKSYGIALLCALILGSCTAITQSDDKPTEEPLETSVATEVTEETTESTAEPTEITTEATTEPTTEPPTEPPTEATETEPIGNTYILNTNTKKFHYPSCSSAKKTKDSNKKTFVGTRDEVIARGYKSCGICHP